jgi:FKBP-type peptidyl-prolyl cis-trans isomerase 2
MQEYTDTEKKALMEIFNMVGYKKYRGQYYQEKTRATLKNKDNLQKGHIVSFKDTDGQTKKGKVIESSLSNIKIVLQHE